ncbi:MAG: hypothetical protein KF870_11275 [Leadbetterella sp.]|nr:hypothetical protein [Leadbetterella sp.]
MAEIVDEAFRPSQWIAVQKEFLAKAPTTTMLCSKPVMALIVKNFRTTIVTLQNGSKVKRWTLSLWWVCSYQFDAPLNTLFVDKNLRYHGLMQAFSRTNRIYDATKTFGNIITFRDLEQTHWATSWIQIPKT